MGTMAKEEKSAWGGVAPNDLPALILATISPSPPMDICSGIASRSQDADSALPMPAARCPLPIARTGI
jgi:hypothetical protein